jgi:dihydroorotate dehydrogenase
VWTLFVRESGDLGFGQWRNTVGPHREDEESKPMMHELEKSDSAIVAMKLVNKAGQPVAEPVERRAGTRRSANQQSTCRAQNRESVSQALGRVRQAATIRCLPPNTPGRSRMP